MIRDPFPFLEQITRVIPPKDVLPVDLDDPAVFNHPRLEDGASLTTHWGGGPNEAGWPIEEPEMTFLQKMAVEFGRVKRVLTSWHNYHRSRGMAAIAYCVAVTPRFGRIIRLRGYRWNGGQWGSINHETLAHVFVLGYGQYPTRQAWRSLGLIWFAMGGPDHYGHRDWNNDPRTQTTTTCPGDDIWRAIHAGEPIKALGVLRYRAGVKMHGITVKAATLRLTELGYLHGKQRRFLLNVHNAVKAFQVDKHLTVDGIVGPATWKALAKG
jgi:hypothetical protein